MALFLGVLDYFGMIRVWHVLVVSALTGFFVSFEQPVRQSILHSLVPRSELPNAVTLYQMVFNGSMLFGPSIGGLLIPFIDTQGCFFVATIGNSIVLLTIFMIHIAPPPQPTNRTTLSQDMAEGLALAWNTPLFLSLFTVLGIVTFCTKPYTQFMQSGNGGFASFDADNDHTYLNEIPFADHGALLDPPTEDVSGRCVMLLAQLATSPQCQSVQKNCLDYLFRSQESDGSWYGRWGTNYIYGTWSVLMGLEEAGIGIEHEAVKRAAAWLKGVQRADGGWGEGCDTYFDPSKRGLGEHSTSFHTAWALLGLMSIGAVHSDSVRRGIDFLLRTQQPNGFWSDPDFNAPGFPRVFYLKYHGYDKYFPLLALARYRNLTAAETWHYREILPLLQQILLGTGYS